MQVYLGMLVPLVESSELCQRRMNSAHVAKIGFGDAFRSP